MAVVAAGMVVSGSRSATMTGGVALHGARQLKAKVLDFAAHLMEASAQGIGAVLLERSAYADDGSYQSATFMDYLMPTACDVPRIEIEHLETCRSTPTSTSAAWAKAA
jgi:CO/xanthine dehydrogenase Mo-binding subunit